MRLSTVSLAHTMTQLDAQPIPDEHPLVGRLRELFGEHTFLLGEEGLHIVEPVGQEQAEADTATVMKVADWEDASHTRLRPHDPEPTDVIVELNPEQAKPKPATN